MSIHIDAQKIREALRIEEIVDEKLNPRIEEINERLIGMIEETVDEKLNPRIEEINERLRGMIEETVDEKLRGIQIPSQTLPILLDLTAFDYTVDIYSDRVVVRDPSGNTTELPSLADLNSWLRNTRDKRILIRAHIYVETYYLRLTRNKYLILGNFKEIFVVEPEVDLVLVGYTEFISNWDREELQYVKLDNASIVVSMSDEVNFTSPVPGEVMKLKRLIVLHTNSLIVWETYIEYMHVRTDTLSMRRVVLKFGVFETLSPIPYWASPSIRVEGILFWRCTMVLDATLDPGQSYTFTFDEVVRGVITADYVYAFMLASEPLISYYTAYLDIFYPTREASISVSESGITVTNTGSTTQTIYVWVPMSIYAYGGLGVPA